LPENNTSIPLSKSGKIFNPKSYTGGNTAELYRGGKDLFLKLTAMIDAAKETIHFQSYILDDDETGRTVCDALKRAAQRGVKVFMILDAWGSRTLSDEFINSLAESGITFRWFGKLITKRGFHIGRRMHHKIVVCDSYASLIGGLNFANRYHGNDGKPPWLDFAVYSEGNISILLEHVCQLFWKRNLLRKPPLFTKKKTDTGPGEKNSILMRVRENDWLMRRLQVIASYRKAVSASKETLTIFGAYFQPGFRFLYRLRKAAQRGVKIRIVVPAMSDSKLGNTARHYIYSFMLRNNISIYEYKRTMLHAKVCVTDNIWSAIGSYDLNNLSAYSNVEANVEILDRSFSESFRRQLDDIIEKDCEQITLESYEKKLTFRNRVRYWVAYHTVRLMFRISILLASKTEE
jgi:cardiolipin synthase A/B